MKVKVLYFASIREALGIAEESVDLKNQLKLNMFIEHLVGSHPTLRGFLPTALFSVNRVYKTPKENIILNNGDEVAIFPPISGG